MPLISGSTTSTNIQYTKIGEIRRNDTASLYSFSSIQFQACGATGRSGPTLAQMQSTYSAYSWASNTAYLNMVGSGIHKWTVPTTGYYRITAAGAPGGGGSDWFSGTSSYDSSGNQGKPGAGIIISANFWLTSGDILYILVGQKGVDTQINNPGGFGPSDTDGGGGGGTFVARKVADATQSQYSFTPDSAYVQPLIVAGGGGGGSSDGDAYNAVFIPNQLASNWAALDQWGYSTGGGWNKYPGDEVYSGLSARIATGLTGGGGSYPNGQKPGYHFLQGGLGGIGGYPQNLGYGNGGFGGGGGAVDEGGAGGGGWIGGINGDNSATISSQGGSSFVSPDSTQVTNDGYNTWSSLTGPNGYCTVTYFGQ